VVGSRMSATDRNTHSTTSSVLCSADTRTRPVSAPGR
jgi:hypothetical protein